jgi:hypothetical protein
VPVSRHGHEFPRESGHSSILFQAFEPLRDGLVPLFAQTWCLCPPWITSRSLNRHPAVPESRHTTGLINATRLTSNRLSIQSHKDGPSGGPVHRGSSANMTSCHLLPRLRRRIAAIRQEIAVKPRSIVFALGLLSLAACVPRTAVVHDGIEGTVIDAETEQAIAMAFIFDRIEDGRPRVLAQSNASGLLQLMPNMRLTFNSPLGEASVFQSLWVCKEGYKPVLVSERSGYNADYTPARYSRLGTIELARSPSHTTDSCSDIKW